MIEGPPVTVINQEIVTVNGGRFLRTNVKGDMPQIGLPHDGWSGPETVYDQPIAVNVFNVNHGKTKTTE